jgi:DNA-binding MarR family transcriptional regulator
MTNTKANTAKESADLRMHLGYQVQMLSLRLTEAGRAVLESYNLTPAKVTALMLIRDNAGCEQSALGRALSINRSSAMKLVNALSELGLIERRTGRDLRSNALHLTKKGRDVTTRAATALRDSERDVTAALTGAELGILIELMEKLRRGGARVKRAAGQLAETK